MVESRYRAYEYIVGMKGVPSLHLTMKLLKQCVSINGKVPLETCHKLSLKISAKRRRGWVLTMFLIVQHIC